MNEELYSILAGTAGLSAAAFIALFLTITRKPRAADTIAHRRVMRLFPLAITLQCVHFVEELITGFYEQFPVILGLLPWSLTFFVSFNVFWIIVWGLTLCSLRMHIRVALFPVWFLGIGSVMNGIAHPLLSVIEGGYFPGLWTSPFVGIVGVLLLNTLVSFTRIEQVPVRTI